MPDSLVLAVTGVSGGLGASSLSAALALRCAVRAGRGVLVDLDLEGGGLEVTTGTEHLSGLRWGDLDRVEGEVDGRRLRAALPWDDDVAVLSAGCDPRRDPVAPTAVGETAVRSVLDGLCGAGGPLVLDLPRHRLVGHLDRLGALVLVMGVHTRSLADADAVVSRVLDGPEPGRRPDVLAVTRGAPPRAEMLDALVEHLGIQHVAHVDDDRGVRRSAERGEWPGLAGPLRRAADLVLDTRDELGAVA